MGGRSPDAADLKSIARSLQPLRLAAGIAVQRAAPTRRKYARHASAEAGGPTARVPRQRALNSSFRRPSAPLSPSRAAGAKPSRGTTSPCRRRHRLAALALATRLCGGRTWYTGYWQPTGQQFLLQRRVLALQASDFGLQR